MLHFNEDTGFYVDEVGDVRADVAAAWTAAFAREGEPPLNTEPETPAGQLIDSQTAAVAEKDSELLYLCNMFDPKRSTGVFQDCLGQIYFLTRKGAVPSQATVTVTGLPGTVIPVAAQIRSVTDDTLWSCTEQVTIPAEGTTTAVFACMTPGAISAAAGTLTPTPSSRDSSSSCSAKKRDSSSFSSSPVMSSGPLGRATVFLAIGCCFRSAARKSARSAVRRMPAAKRTRSSAS